MTGILTKITSVKKSLVEMSISADLSKIPMGKFWRTDSLLKFLVMDHTEELTTRQYHFSRDFDGLTAH